MTARVAAALAVAATLVLTPAARADGDPASDYLITQPMFLAVRREGLGQGGEGLNGLLADAKKQGFPLKVAVIVDRVRSRCGPELFGKPQQYASFLGQEDSSTSSSSRCSS